MSIAEHVSACLDNRFFRCIISSMRFLRYSEILGLVPVLAATLSLAGCGDVSVGGAGNGSDFLQASSIDAGDFHSCAISNGGVKCWGRGSSGQIGNDSTANALVPVLVSNLTGTVTQVSAGGRHTCARLSNGDVWCWGENSDGQLGNGTFTGSRVPVQVTGISTAAAVSAGGNHTCAVLADGTLRCWGNNLRGQLGNNSTNDSNVPVLVSLPTTVDAVAAGGSHTCAILSDGTVRCWGSNTLEQLGNASLLAGSFSRVPIEATGVASATNIEAGTNHTCVRVTSPGTRVRCWGDNIAGQLGSAWTVIAFPFFETTSNQALTVNNLTTPLGSIAAGLEHSCAALTNNTVNCWGENAAGQLGNGTIAGFTPPGAGASVSSTVFPVSVSGIGSATQVSAGQFHTCALLASGTVRCWGSNIFGQLGDSTTISAFTPVQVVDSPTAGLR